MDELLPSFLGPTDDDELMMRAPSYAAGDGGAAAPKWNLRTALWETASNLGRVTEAARELLRDKELRKKGATFLVARAQESFQELQKGITKNATILGKQISQRVDMNKQQIITLMSRLEKQINEYQREKQLRDHKQRAVDVQIGIELYEDVPQELRCRLWMALLEDPSLAEPFRPIQCRHHLGTDLTPYTQAPDLSPAPVLGQQSTAVGQAATSAATSGSPFGNPQGPAAESGDSGQASTAAAAASAGQPHPVADLVTFDSLPGDSGPLPCDTVSAGSALQGDQAHGAEQQQEAGGQATPAWISGSDGFMTAPGAGPGAGAGAGPGAGAGGSEGVLSLDDYIDELMGGSSAVQAAAEQLQALSSLRPAVPAAASPPAAPEAADPEPTASAAGRADQPQQASHQAQPSQSGSGSSGAQGQGQGKAKLQPPLTSKTSELGDWEMVPEGAVSSIYGFAGANEQVQQRLKQLIAGLDHENPGGMPEAEQSARVRLVQAMLDVPWSTTEGVPAAYAQESRFAILNDMTAGQEEVDDIIRRDIHRTFPEHPLFSSAPDDGRPGSTSSAAAAGTAAAAAGGGVGGPTHRTDGQESLFRVLKAYSLHDLEVGYCQGMAFVAGIVLMYLPQEPAFRLFCRLMDPEGPNLRRMYLPGLDALKEKLAVFEALLAQLHPELHAHIQAHGVPSVLYASQWFMTIFSTPFPAHFSARVIDVMLQDGNDHLLLRIAIVIMQHLEAHLLQLDDFEQLVTQLKVPPARWSLNKLRQVFDEALLSPITDAQLEAALAEAARQLANSPTGARHSRHSSQLPSRGSGGGDATPNGAGGSGTQPDSDLICLSPSAARQQDGGGGGMSQSDLIDLEGELLAGGLDLSGLGIGGRPGLEIDDEYMKMIMELDLLTPAEEKAMTGGRGGQPAAAAAPRQDQQ